MASDLYRSVQQYPSCQLEWTSNCSQHDAVGEWDLPKGKHHQHPSTEPQRTVLGVSNTHTLDSISLSWKYFRGHTGCVECQVVSIMLCWNWSILSVRLTTLQSDNLFVYSQPGGLTKVQWSGWDRSGGLASGSLSATGMAAHRCCPLQRHQVLRKSLYDPFPVCVW